MKTKIALLFISLFTLISCSSDETSPTAPSAPSAVNAVLNADTVNLTWSPVEGTGITYNVYKNGSAVKINTVPLTEAKFTDVLKATGAFTYTVTASLNGLEGAKSVVSEKIMLELPKTQNIERSDKYNIVKYEYSYTYDTSNITKLATVIVKYSNTNVKTQTTTVLNTITKYTYSGDLITKSMNYSDDNVFKGSTEYAYNEQKKIISGTRKNPDGSISYKVTYTYNVDGTITEKYDLPDYGVGIYTFDKGNLVKYSITTPTPGEEFLAVSNYIYDTKKDPLADILGFNRFLINTVNNAISSSTIITSTLGNNSTESSKTDCTYDENGYVLTKMKSVTMPPNGVMQTEKTVVTYY
ncbi:hypothetical protein [Flavobacterium sp. 2]|uniref:hypothetical protein n=1 Tax=Flavobacterium sp. 2 TaxID=308053 RepID=UPI003CF2ECF1